MTIKNKSIILSLAVVVGTSLGFKATFADTIVHTNIHTNASSTASSTVHLTVKQTHLQASSTTLQSRAITEIDRRITSLNSLVTKVTDMKKITSDEQTNLTTSIQSQITLLTDLKTKINADTDPATLKSDIQSITKSYRIYDLVLPQVSILAAADRLGTTADLMTTLSTALQSRIAAATSTSGLSTKLSDMQSNIANMKVQSQAAISAVVNLQPDNGSTSVASTNNTGLKTGRAAIKTGTTDATTAQKDEKAIIQALKKSEGIETVQATTTVQ